jgi:hypothetical protein
MRSFLMPTAQLNIRTLKVSKFLLARKSIGLDSRQQITVLARLVAQQSWISFTRRCR